jgi:UDP-3-O-[3-hydroxymyristoyl] glucosamine N-acyltransferase
MNLFEIAQHVGADVTSETRHSTVAISRGASLADAQEGDIVFYDNPRYLRSLRETKARSSCCASPSLP